MSGWDEKQPPPPHPQNNKKRKSLSPVAGPASSSPATPPPPVSVGQTGPRPGSAEKAEASAAPRRRQPLDRGEVRPWKVALGCFALTVPTYGLLSGIGLFQTYWHRTLLADHSEADIAWIVSLFGFLDCLLAGPAGVMLDRYGCGGRGSGRLLLPLGSAVYAAAFVALAWCRTYAAFMACMAVAGAAAGMCNITYSGRSSQLVITTASAPLHVRSNVDTSQLTRHLKTTAYELVLFIQWGSIPSYAVAADVGNKQFYLMMSYNIGAVVGRTVPPWLSDRLLGPLNATIVMNGFTLLAVLAIWLPLGGSSVAALFVVVVLMGIGTGSFVPLGVSCINALCRSDNAGTWLGSVYSITSFATLIGNPVSAAILTRYQPSGLLVFLAAVLLSGMISAAALRWLSHGRRWLLKARV
ncbi:uncharacterized protein P884DRAFT_322397 [Thermothelomyces heterothallicus CBS 202.75]|uniref:uncharacterized protein n=1 Tax=Thermothelomyces heterothallicus CBS 202.75 TaxID=1149848 RepID=UPI0037440942